MVFFHLSQVTDFRIIELGLNNLCIVLLDSVLFFKLFPRLLIKGIHLPHFLLNPQLLNLFLLVFLPFLQLGLPLPLLEHFREHHLRMESLHLVFIVMHVLVGLRNRLLSGFSRQLVLDFVNLSSFHLRSS